jgi:nucleoside phosphorylase
VQDQAYKQQELIEVSLGDIMNFKLALLCALKIEAEPIIQRFSLKEASDIFDKRLGLRVFLDEKDAALCLVYFGQCPSRGVERIGTQVASLAAWETIRTLNPSMLASVGTAGGFKVRGAQIGDVYISEGPIYFHGRHIPVPGYEDFELGKFPSVSIKNTGFLKKGTISSSDSIPLSAIDQEKILRLEADAKDMEAAAVAEVAYLAGVPMFALKAISDYVDSTEATHEQFLANFKLATYKLAEALERLVLEAKVF